MLASLGTNQSYRPGFSPVWQVNINKEGNLLMSDYCYEQSGMHVSACPDGYGKITSSMCCGEDMSCSIG